MKHPVLLRSSDLVRNGARHHIAVVGVGGVGMAHVCAAVRCDYRVDCLIDTDGQVLEGIDRLARLGDQRGQIWENRWPGYAEHVQAQATTALSTDLDLLVNFEQTLDLVVIATPPHTHADLILQVLHRLPYVLILCEKPTSYPQTHFAAGPTDLVFSVAEWCYHRGIEQHVVGQTDRGYCFRDLVLRSAPPAPSWSWPYKMPLLMDLGPHLLALVEHFMGTVVRVTPVHDPRIEAVGGFLVLAHTTAGNVRLAGTRQPPYGLVVDGTIHAWQPDLFDHQLRATFDGSAITFHRAAELDRMLVRALPPKT